MKKATNKGLSINIILLGVVSFLNDASSEMIIPILPLFIASLGGTGLIIGLIGGVRDSISSLLKVVCGYWSDKTGKRKMFVFSGYLTSALFKLLLSLSTIWHHIFVFSSLERVGKGIRTAPRDAIIAESAEKSVRGKAYGFHRAMDGIGSITGAVLAFILLPILGFKQIFLLAFIPGAIAVLFILFIKEKKVIKKTNNMSLTCCRKSFISYTLC